MFCHLERKCLYSRNHNGKKNTKNTQDTPDFWLENKIFANNLRVFIITAVLLYLVHLLSLHKSLVYPTFMYILYDECSEDVRGECSSAKYKMRN